MVVQRRIKKFVLNQLEKKLNEQDAKNDIMPGLAPIGDTGLYRSSLEPVSPFDCARYPDSPYCGGFPISPFAFELQPVIHIDSCNIGIRINQTVGFIKFPPLALVYRYPECRKLPPEPLPASDNYSIPVRIPPNNCDAANAPTVILVFRDSYFAYEKVENYDGKGNFIEAISNGTVSLIRFDYPVIPTETKRIITATGYIETPVFGYVTLRVQSTFKANANYAREVWRDFSGNGIDNSSDRTETIKITHYEESYNVFGTGVGTGRLGLIWRNLSRATEYINRNNIVNSSFTQTRIDHRGGYFLPEYIATITESETENFTVLVKCGQYSNSNRNNPAPPLQEEPCCMKCCPPHDDSLVKLLIKKIDKLSEIVGVDDYPVKLPKSLITKTEGFPGNLIPDGEDEIASLTRLQTWYFERFDEIMGQWEIPIEIKDSDPSTPGDQPKGVKLPNMAEAIAEIFTLNFQSYINTETILNIAVRNLIETGTDKQQNFVTYKLLQSLTDWVGFKQKDIKLEMPLSFNPGKTKFDELLQETKVKVNCVEFDDKFGLEADLMRFREAAAILQAVYKRRLNPNGDIKGQILKYLLDTYNAVKKVNENDESFSDFINRVENGFTDIPTVGDPTQPYGRPYAQRPKIRDLTDIDEQT
ncbi:hypothetical protein [Gloeocapsa sp. PCC 7428]|uniref:hypothetical protein n=1 Tax=Gloeocapsa sp. PCC 7428 TaxID=1173026 RepID=UPI0012DE08A1|nr:hypothetical protein [Gloeocapsa sp. PCC 7428]